LGPRFRLGGLGSRIGPGGLGVLLRPVLLRARLRPVLLRARLRPGLLRGTALLRLAAGVPAGSVVSGCDRRLHRFSAHRKPHALVHESRGGRAGPGPAWRGPATTRSTETETPRRVRPVGERTVI